MSVTEPLYSRDDLTSHHILIEVRPRLADADLVAPNDDEGDFFGELGITLSAMDGILLMGNS